MSDTDDEDEAVVPPADTAPMDVDVVESAPPAEIGGDQKMEEA